jgi:hypothetical protein
MTLIVPKHIAEKHAAEKAKERGDSGENLHVRLAGFLAKLAKAQGGLAVNGLPSNVPTTVALNAKDIQGLLEEYDAALPEEDVDRLKAQIQNYEKALKFYADPDTWKARGHPQIDADTAPIVGDRGQVAAAALSDSAHEANADPDS